MPYLGIATRTGACGICKKPTTKGEPVYHDPTKREGAHLAHKACFEPIRDKRGVKQKPPGKKKLSDEPLDPPF